MTPPSEPEPQDGRHATPGADAADPLDQAASDRLDGLPVADHAHDGELDQRASQFDAVRRLMIDEPVPEEAHSRDARVARAMAASAPAADAPPADLAERRSSRSPAARPVRPLLVAAAVVAVAGVGALALSSIGGSGEDVASSGGSAESTATEDGDGEDAAELETAPAESTTAPPQALAESDAAQGDVAERSGEELGSFDSVAELLAAVAVRSRAGPTDAGREPTPDGVCEAERARLGARVVGIASIRDDAVVVLFATDPAETIVVSSSTCEEIGRAPLE